MKAPSATFPSPSNEWFFIVTVSAQLAVEAKTSVAANTCKLRKIQRAITDDARTAVNHLP